MSYIHLLYQKLIKNYTLVGFLLGYLFIYFLAYVSPFYFYNINQDKTINSLNLPFTYDEKIQNQKSLSAKDSFKLKNKTRILCWVMTSPKNFDRAKHVKATWGKYCDVLLFMSSQAEDTLPVIGLPVLEGYDNLWGKTKAAFYYVYKHYQNKADWFLKADDDTFVVVENLRYLLDKHNSDSPIYFGRRFKPYVKQGYMSGGAGYVLSHEALRLFVEKSMKAMFSEMCYLGVFGPEDINIGECLSYAGVRAGDSRDNHHLETFHPYTVELLMIKGLIPPDDWLHSYVYYPLQIGENCCSNETISFHYVVPQLMYVYEYFVHVLDVYGSSSIVTKLDTTKSWHKDSKSLKNFIKT